MQFKVVRLYRTCCTQLSICVSHVPNLVTKSRWQNFMETCRNMTFYIYGYNPHLCQQETFWKNFFLFFLPPQGDCYEICCSCFLQSIAVCYTFCLMRLVQDSNGVCTLALLQVCVLWDCWFCTFHFSSFVTKAYSLFSLSVSLFPGIAQYQK